LEGEFLGGQLELYLTPRQMNEVEEVKKGLAERILSKGPDLLRFAVELDEPADTVSKTFPDALENYLHIIVQGQKAGEC